MTLTVAAAALGWLSRDSRARLMLTQVLDVLWCSPAAEALLGDSIGIHIREDKLTFADPQALRMVTTFVANLGQDVATLIMSQEENSAGMIMRGFLIGSRPDPVVCLELLSNGHDAGASYGDLDAVYALTPAEHRVLLGMLGGQNVPALARRLGISVETVRTHVRRIYAKTGVGTREEMFSKLQLYRND